MVLPVAAAIQVAGSYMQTVVFSVAFVLISMISGLFISYYADFRPGGTIVLVSVAVLLLVLVYKRTIQSVVNKIFSTLLIRVLKKS